MRARPGPAGLVGGLLVLAVGLAVGIDVTASAATAPQAGTRCQQAADAYHSALRAPVTAGTAGLVVVIGDSYSQGAGLPTGRAAAFPALLARDTGRPVLLDGFSSTGLTTRGLCPQLPVSYGERLAADRLLAVRPTTVIVEGGANDVRHGHPGDVGAAATALLTRLAAVPQVIVVGPADIRTADPVRLTTVDAALAAATHAAGRQYVGLRDEPLPMQGGGIHPTQAGQAAIARLLVPLLRQPAPPTIS